MDEEIKKGLRKAFLLPDDEEAEAEKEKLRLQKLKEEQSQTNLDNMA